MKRRVFLKSSAVTALGSFTLNPLRDLYLPLRQDINFLKVQSQNHMLYPRPLDGKEVEISPPGLTWLPAPGSSAYRIQIRNEANRMVFDATTDDDPALLPDEILLPGKYKWNVFALDPDGKKVAERGEQSFTIAENVPGLSWPDTEELLSRVSRERSRVLYPSQKLPEIREAIKGPRKKAWQQLYKRAEEALDLPAPPYPQYQHLADPQEERLSYTDYFRDFRRYIDGALKNLSLAYLISEEERFAVSAKRILLEVASWSAADDDPTSVRARYDEAGLSLAKYGHKAFDWLYHALSEDEKEKVLSMCIGRAGQAYRHLKEGHRYITIPGINHDSRTITFLVEMSIALAHESPDAKTWLDYALKACTTVYPHWAGTDGGWGNGLPYSVWYNDLYVSPFLTLREQTGFDIWQRPFFRKFRNFYFYCSTPKAEIGPFGDGAERAAPASGSAANFSSLMWFHAHNYKDPNTGWWANRTPEIGNISGDYTLLYDAMAPERKPDNVPHSKHFRGIGWAALHSDLTDPENDNFMLFKSSPYGSVSHNHADQNAFAIMKGGKALAIPSGYYGPAYGQPHHNLWTRSSKANNTILVNGEGQEWNNREANGDIVRFEDQKGHSYVAGDATNAYVGKLAKFVRHIIMLRPSVILMLDELEAPAPASYQWMLHAFEQMKIVGNSITSSRAGKHLEANLYAPVKLELSQTDKFDTPFNHGVPEQFHRDVEKQWHVEASTESVEEKLRIAAVMTLYDDTFKPEVEVSKNRDWLHVEVKGKDGSSEAWLNLDPAGRVPRALSDHEDIEQALMLGVDAQGTKFRY